MSEQLQQKELPPKYYLDYFNTILYFVEDKYGSLLLDTEIAFINKFNALSEDARCLFLRFANRRSTFFRVDKLSYAEIKDIAACLKELQTCNFCEEAGKQHAALAEDFLNIYNKGELQKAFQVVVPEAKGLHKLKKPELVEKIVAANVWSDLCKVLQELYGNVVQHQFVQELEVLKFLFFGYVGGEIAEFVVRDLGVVRFEAPDESKLVAKFSSRQEIEDRFAISLAYEHFRVLREKNCPESLYSWYMEWCSQGKKLGEHARPTFDQLTIKLAKILEKNKLSDWALEVYEHTDVAPSRERRARILHKNGEVQEALALCHQMQMNPQNADELFFAKDFTDKLTKKKATKRTTSHLKLAEVVQISEDYKYNVEKGVIHHYADLGYEALYSENYLWRSLFGLVFWDVIFDQDVQVYHSPLQRAPSDLFLPEFLGRRKDKMLERIRSLSSTSLLVEHVEKVYDEKWGIGNPLIGWHENTLPLARAACRKLQPTQLQAVFLEMAANLKENGRGFPDIFAWTEKDYCFIEVKSPNDTLSAQQLFWLQFFANQGIKSKVMKVEWY